MNFALLGFIVYLILILQILTWEKVTWQGVIAGLITGFSARGIWSELKALDAVISVRFVSWIAAILVVWITSIVNRKNILYQEA